MPLLCPQCLPLGAEHCRKGDLRYGPGKSEKERVKERQREEKGTLLSCCVIVGTLDRLFPLIFTTTLCSLLIMKLKPREIKQPSQGHRFSE